jgi:hypothetical protein
MSLLGDRPSDDAMRDALALIQCVHNGDLEGGQAVLANANLQLTAAGLARIAADLLEDLTEDPAVALVLLREHFSGG